MADLASSDVTVTVSDRWIEGNKKVALVSIAFGNGALTYPSGGVPLPTYVSFGMKRNISSLMLTDASNADGYIYKYDLTNNKIRIYYPTKAQSAVTTSTNAGSVATTCTQGTVTVTSATGNGDAGAFNTVGVALANGTVTIPSGFRSAVDAGAGTEVTASSFAPAATTIKAVVYGW